MTELLTTTPLLAWAVTPVFFWAGLALASLPIIIHFLNRRRYKVVPWAAMEYLLQALRKNRRRVKFEQIILLAVRCCVLLLLGLALARPLSCTNSSIAALAGQRSGLHIFVIDNSYSMAYEAERPNAKTHLDQAKFLAKQQIDTLLAGNEQVAIISAARQERTTPATASPQPMPVPDPVVFRPSYDLDAAKGAIDRMEQSYGGTDLAGALQAAVQVARQQQKQPVKSLYILTDFTRSAWETDKSELLKQTGQDLSSAFGSRIRLHNLGREGQWNYAILGLSSDGGLVRSNFDAAFLANIKGFGPGPETLVQWKWDDAILPATATLKPDESTDPQRLAKSDLRQGGEHVLAVSLVNDERLKLDNTRYRVVEVAAALKTLVVEGERGSNVQSSSGSSLAFALAPKTEIAPDGSIRSSTYVVPEVISDLEFGNKVLADYNAVILTNVASLSPPQADQLAKWVRQGGTLMIFLGEQVNPDAYNSILLSRKLLPGKLVARKSPPAGAKYTFDFSPTSPILHPLLADFKDVERSGLDTVEIQTYYQVELDPASKAEVVLTYQAANNQASDPAITRHPLDKGNIVLVTTTANTDWNTLPPKPAYIPLIHGLLAGNVDSGDKWMNLTVGQCVQVPAGLKLTIAPILTDVSRRQIPIEAITSADGQTAYLSKPLEKPGIYQLNIGRKTIPIAVNVPSDEADLRLLPQAAIVKVLGGIDLAILGDTLPAGSLARDEGNDLGWSLMLIVLALVAAECFLAMRFGHYRRKC